MLSELKAYLPDYQKGANHIFTMLLGQLDHAKHNAERSLRAAKASQTDNPTTRIHELVSFLQAIKR